MNLLINNRQLVALMWSDPLVFGITPRSRVPNVGDDIFPVKVLPLQLAKSIQQELNNTEVPPYKIHFYPTHAELWLTQHWDGSTSKRLKALEDSRLRVLAFNEEQTANQLLNECISAVMNALDHLKVGYGAAVMTAVEILNGTIPKESIEELELTVIYTRYGNKAHERKDRAANPAAEATTCSPAETTPTTTSGQTSKLGSSGEGLEHHGPTTT